MTISYNTQISYARFLKIELVLIHAEHRQRESHHMAKIRVCTNQYISCPCPHSPSEAPRVEYLAPPGILPQTSQGQSGVRYSRKQYPRPQHRTTPRRQKSKNDSSHVYITLTTTSTFSHPLRSGCGMPLSSSKQMSHHQQIQYPTPSHQISAFTPWHHGLTTGCTLQ